MWWLMLANVDVSILDEIRFLDLAAELFVYCCEAASCHTH